VGDDVGVDVDVVMLGRRVVVRMVDRRVGDLGGARVQLFC